MTTILVTGATGNVGGACARHLLSSGATVRCLVRDSTSEKSLALKAAGAELVSGDFAHAASLAAALVGVDSVLLACSNQPEQVDLETNAIRAAADSASCKYLVKLSTCGCAGYCTADSAIEYGRWHAAVESALEAQASLSWTVLQPNDYMQNHLGDVFGSLPHKSLSYPHTSSVARIVDARDVGEVGAKLLLLGAEARAAHHGQRYHVCGPSGVSVRGLAALYETALSLPAGAVACVEGLSEAAFAESLVAQAGMPRWLAVAARVAKYQSTSPAPLACLIRAPCFFQVARNHAFWAEGKLDYPSSEAVLALHPTLRTVEAWVEEHAPLVQWRFRLLGVSGVCL